MKPIPATLQTTYANLLQAHLNRSDFEIEGAPFKRTVKGKTYWYAIQRVAGAAATRQKYLGPDTEDMRSRVEKMQAAKQSLSEFRSYTSSLVAQLRLGGVTGPDRTTGPILRALANSGAFRLGGTLVGTQAFRHYEMELGLLLSQEMESITQTDDLDLASFANLSMAIEDAADPDLAEAIAKLGFEPAPTQTPQTPTRWTLPNKAYRIDFLTPSFEDEEGPIRLAALKVWAHGFHYLNFLIRNPMPAVSIYMEGLLVQIPRPERYAVHKLIVSERRGAGFGPKTRKDIEQAWFLICALAETRPHELYAALAEADANGARWRTKLDSALAVKFSAPAQRYDFDRDIVTFEGVALSQTIRFAISGEALEDHFGASNSSSVARLESARSNRFGIERLADRKFRVAPAPEILIATADVPALLQ